MGLRRRPPAQQSEVDTKGSRQEMRSGFLIAAGLFATDVGYGFLALEPLGHSYARDGIVAAILASIIGTLVRLFVGASITLFGRPRPAQTLIFAAMLADLVSVIGLQDPFRIALIGAFFGEMGLLRGGAPRTSDAIAMTDTTVVLRLTDADLSRLHRAHPEIALQLIRNVGAHLSARLAATTSDLRYALSDKSDLESKRSHA